MSQDLVQWTIRFFQLTSFINELKSFIHMRAAGYKEAPGRSFGFRLPFLPSQPLGFDKIIGLSRG